MQYEILKTVKCGVECFSSEQGTIVEDAYTLNAAYKECAEYTRICGDCGCKYEVRETKQ